MMRPFSETGRKCIGRRGKRLVGIMLFSCLMGMLIPSLSSGADDKAVIKFVGKNWVNGRSWEKLDYSGKLGFVCGVFDGITLFWSMTEGGQGGKKGVLNSAYNSLSLPSTLTVGDVVVGMDDFYKDPENMSLPAICAYLYFVAKSRGDGFEAIDKRVQKWRKMFGR